MVEAAAFPPVNDPETVVLPVKVGDAELAFKPSAVVTNAVVAICVVAVPGVAVGANGAPVSVGDAKFAFRSREVCVAVETGLLASLVLSTFVKPISAFTIPVGEFIIGLANVLLVNVAVAAFFAASLVLFTFPKPTIVEVIPVTVPVKIGDAKGAFKSNAVVDAFASRAV